MKQHIPFVIHSDVDLTAEALATCPAAVLLLPESDLFFDYLVAGAAAFLAFLSLCPWIPGKRGITKAILSDTILLAILLISRFLPGFDIRFFRPFLIIAMIMLPLYGLELGGIASTMRSDLDPFLARRGIGAIGNISFAGTVRTEILNGYRVLTCDREICNGCRTCTEVCPQGVWQMGRDKRAEMVRKDACTACRACLVQCETGAIQALRAKPGEA
jgi:NAD-dependent dihydropyrimidine dehydrogenase PreA subunit